MEYYWVFLDVAYHDQDAVAAAIVTPGHDTGKIISSYTTVSRKVADYEPGFFYKRELPCLVSVLGKVKEPLGLIFIDAHVWLSRRYPGLGARLFDSLGRRVPVVGLAKSPFSQKLDAKVVRKVFRGSSTRPLYVSAEGISLNTAASMVLRLHGRYRIPLAMKAAHQLAQKELIYEVGDRHGGCAASR